MPLHGPRIRFHHSSAQGAQQADACREGARHQRHPEVPILQVFVSEIGPCRHANHNLSVRVFQEHKDGELPFHEGDTFFTRTKKNKLIVCIHVEV